MPYHQPTRSAQAYQARIEIKKSVFIALAKRITNRSEAMNWLAEIQTAYRDARHHCWAYVIGDPSNATHAGTGDDGEPSGTAGKPILNVLTHKNIGNTMLIVVRYFGGIKLGAGGLTRAYGQAAQAVCQAMVLEDWIEQRLVSLRGSFEHEHPLRYLIEKHQGQWLDTHYGTDVTLTAQLPQHTYAAFLADLQGMGVTPLDEE